MLTNDNGRAARTRTIDHVSERGLCRTRTHFIAAIVVFTVFPTIKGEREALSGTKEWLLPTLSPSLPEIKHDALEDPSLRPVIVIRKKGVFQFHRKMLGQRTYQWTKGEESKTKRSLKLLLNIEVHSRKTAY